MRHLYLLRGAMGVGKSTLIEKYNLEPFTLSADKIRSMYGNVDYEINYDEEGNATVKETVNSLMESRVWDTLLGMLEDRMSRGETTIIDATHSNTRLMRTYNKLVEKYRYRVFTIQLNRPLEDILEGNRSRAEYKIVNEKAVIRKYHDVQNSTPNIAKRYGLHQFGNIEDAGEFILTNSTWRVKEISPTQYKKVYVIGDIHASYEVLKEFMDEYYNQDNYYIFLGDYLDRGLMPYETVKLLHDIHLNKNVVMLRGNHETNYENWLMTPELYTEDVIKINNISEKQVRKNAREHKKHKRLTRSSNRYLAELKRDITEEEFKDFRKKLKDVLMRVQDITMFNIQGQDYVCTHGGITKEVLNYHNTGSMLHFSADHMIRGVGDYGDDIDTIYNNQMLMLPKDERVIQIHGHRNQFNKRVLEDEYSINLEQFISDGGQLGLIEIDTLTGRIKDISKDNRHYRMTLKNTPLNEYPISKLYEDSIKDKYIRVKKLETVDGVYSLNFNEKAFREKKWTDRTVRARGLFINPEEERIVARSYEKFFNLNERKHTKLNTLEEHYTLPMTVSSKVNGFLGVLSSYQGELLYLSKSTDNSRFSHLFKDTFIQHVNELGIDLDSVKALIERENISLVFEVIDNEKDPHINKYENKGVVLLDAIRNELEEEILDKDKFKELDKFIKPEEIEIDDWDTLKQYVKDFNKNIYVRTDPTLENVGEKISQYNEGVILTDANNQKIKVKGAYYNTWRSVRPILQRKLRNKKARVWNNLGREMVDFIDNHRKEELTDSVIIEREAYIKYLEESGKDEGN